ncbi:MAG: glycosyltransferase family 4 protein [Candidatus Moranbacteria bacterium]|jgi:glycosyltransferase involved in cell wall biosynthesis|nr:glycosyltransferase family 4 protein [Candidatus Moranbacteria bacterium]
MKIAFIGQKGIPARSGGVERHVERLAVSMAAAGHDVVVYSRKHYTGDTARDFQGVSRVFMPSIRTKHLDALSHTCIATFHALFQDYDIIHFHSIGPSIFSILPRLLRPDVRVVATFHSRDYFHQKWNGFARLCLHFAEWVTCRVPERTITISKTLADYATQTYHRSFAMIPNGADVHISENTDLIRDFGLKEGRYLLSVSRLVRHKGIHYLIKAFQALKETSELPGNGWKLVIVGTHAETQEYADYLRFLSAGDPDILLLGERSGETLFQLYSHAGIFVQPSEDEGLSLALLEALGYGLPCVVSDIPANLEAIAQCGIRFESKNILDLKQKLSALVNRPDIMTTLGTLARERALAEYDWQAIARRTISLYEDLLVEKPSIWKASFGLKNK